MSGEHEPAPVPAPDPREAPYSLRGHFLEVCDCFTICPCWVGRAPDEDACTGVFAWVIEEGTIAKVDVAGRTVVSISTHQGHRDLALQRVVIFVDQGASDEQAALLATTFAGANGGPLGELSELLGDLLAVERAEISTEIEGRRARLTVGRIIELDTALTLGPNGEATSLANARLSSVLGNPASVGLASRLKVGLPANGIDIDLRGRSAMRGSFAYRHAPAAA
jgi:hypothetical protein